MCMMIIQIAPIVTMTSRILSSDTEKNIIDPIKPYSAFIGWYRSNLPHRIRVPVEQDLLFCWDLLDSHPTTTHFGSK